MNIRETLQQKDENGKDRILLTDGAMGTYYAALTGDVRGFCELANIGNPDIIRRIHQEYLDAGAMLLRTNTFAANRFALDVSREEQTRILQAGAALALEAAGPKGAFAAGSIGPIRRTGEEDEDEIFAEYLFMAKTLYDAGIRIFVFETFSDPAGLCRIGEILKSWDPDVFFLASFAFSADGLTRDGYGLSSVAGEFRDCPHLDALGLNCGSGPSQLRRLAETLEPEGRLLSVLPNASYPELVNERTVYVNNPEYFALVMEEIAALGVRIVGGCCGTTPEHIRRLALALGSGPLHREAPAHPARVHPSSHPVEESAFHKKLAEGDFVLAVELDPPFDLDLGSLRSQAASCREAGIDLITVADSPRGIARVDSLMTAALIRRETGMEVMPHLCCRDKNINAIRSGLMACHIEGIRNILAVTGDPILEADKVTTKSVFNLNSFRLIELIEIMNGELCPEDRIAVAAALNLNAGDLAGEFARIGKKAAKGACVFLTQPVFDQGGVEALRKLREAYGVKVVAGIMPLVSRRNAVFLRNEIPGFRISEALVEAFPPEHSRSEGEAAGIRLAADMAAKARPYVDGFYFVIPLGRTHVVLELIETLRARGILTPRLGQNADAASGRRV
jgi:homocysteine S-methyltransferase